MMTTYTRYKRELAIVLIVAIVITMVGCKKKKAGSESELSSILSSETETTPEETTTESTSESASEVTTSTVPSDAETTPEMTIVPPSVPATSETVPTETTLDPTATPTDKPADPTATSTPKPTKAPKETKKADPTPTTPPTNTPTNTSTPTPVPATPTPTPTKSVTMPKPNLSKSTALSAMKDAVRDYCGGHTITFTNSSGVEVTETFQFHDAVMSNAQKRADYYPASGGSIGHLDISGTWNAMEACGTMTCEPIYNDGNPYWRYSWTDDNGTRHSYDNLYDAVYASTVYDVTQHSKKLSSEDYRVFYGVGFSVMTCSLLEDYGGYTIDPWLVNYGISGVENYYKFGTYVCGDGIGDAENHGYYVT